MKAESKKQAEELGITIDKGWSEAQLQEQIDLALAAPAHNPPGGEQIIPPIAPPSEAHKPADDIGMDKKEKTTPVKLLYDTWLEADVRTPAGEVVELPLSKAKELIAAGKADRADKLPGE